MQIALSYIENFNFLSSTASYVWIDNYNSKEFRSFHKINKNLATQLFVLGRKFLKPSFDARKGSVLKEDVSSTKVPEVSSLSSHFSLNHAN